MNSTLRNLTPVEGWADRLPFALWMQIWRLKVKSEREFWKNIGFILPDNPNVVVHATYGVEFHPTECALGGVPKPDWETAKSSLKYLMTLLKWYWRCKHSVSKVPIVDVRHNGRQHFWRHRFTLSTIQTMHEGKPYRNVPVGVKRKRELEPIRARLCDELKRRYSLEPWPFHNNHNLECPFPVQHPQYCNHSPSLVVDLSEP